MDAREAAISVLVVTADREYAAACENHLPSHIEVSVVTTVRDAIDRFVSGDELDCIVSDHDLPDTDGVAFLEAVRAQNPTLPFVLFTDAGSEVVASRAISADVTEYLIRGDHSDQWDRLASLIGDAVAYYRQYDDLVDPEYRTKTLLDAAHDVIAVVRDGRIEYINKTGVELVEAETRAAVVGQAVDAVLATVNDDSLDEKLTAVQRRERVLDRVKRHVRRSDGEVFPIEITATAADWLDTAAVVLIVRDVSERTEREQDLHLKNRVMDSAPIGITIADARSPDEPLIYVNEKFEELTGYSEAEACGHNCRFLQGEDTDPDRIAEIREAVDANEPVTVELRNYRTDGSEFWNRVTIAPIRNSAGEVTHYVGFQEEVTEQKERERTLRQYEYAIESASDLIAAVDEDYRFLFANRAYRDFYDLDERDVTETTLPEVVNEETWETIKPHVDRNLEGTYVQFEMGRSRPDRQDHTFDIRYHSLERVDTELKGSMATMRDITAQRERERQLASLDRMLRHNLHNELNVIMGRAEMISARASGEIAEWARLIDRVAERLLVKTDKQREIVELLSRPMTVTTIDLSEVVDDVITRMEDRFPDAKLTVEMPDELQVATLPEIGRALEEVIENAIVHSESDTPVVAVRAGRQATTITLTVEDDGPGVPAEEQKVIVDDADIEPLLHSNGMGLWLAKRILSRADGTLRFGGDGSGSSVTLALPRKS